MKMTFIETPVFTEMITELLSDDDYREMQEHLLMSPTVGPVITNTAGCRKLRWKVSGRKGGKSGGMRGIYYHRMAQDQIIFLLAYDHREVDDLTQEQKKQLAAVVQQLRREP